MRLGGIIVLILLKVQKWDILKKMAPYVKLFDLLAAEKLASTLEANLKKGSDEVAISLMNVVEKIVVLQGQHNKNLLYSLLYRREALMNIFSSQMMSISN